MQLLRDEWRPLQAASGGELDLSRLLEIAETVPQHGINAGVVGVRRGAPILDRWLEVSHRASALAIPDEMALHLLLPLCEYAILGQRYNCWPLYFPNVRDVRIWHFVGCTHLRPGKSSQLWRPAYEECRRRDTARITQWSKIESRNGTVERPSL
jgi:hypothetical protein